MTWHCRREGRVCASMVSSSSSAFTSTEMRESASRACKGTRNGMEMPCHAEINHAKERHDLPRSPSKPRQPNSLTSLLQAPVCKLPRHLDLTSQPTLVLVVIHRI